MKRTNNKGYSLIELLISMVIGSVMLAGVLNVYVNSNNAFQVSSSLNTLVSDGRFATHLIRQDVQLSGSFGLVQPGGIITDTGIANIANDCAVQWFANTSINLIGFNDNNPYAATCIDAADGYVANTDVMVVRYAEPLVTANANISANTVYMRNTLSEGALFTNIVPVLPSETVDFPGQNNQLQTIAYYISDYTDTAGDGYPSLRRIRLVSGPSIEDEVVVPGVQDMQIQYGLDSDNDGSVDQYVNANNPILNWATDQDRVLSVSISLLLVAENPENGLDTSNTFNYADKQVVVANDSRLRRLITTVIPLKNKLNN